MDLTRTSKNEVIKELVRIFDVTRDSCLMIGDRADDILAARAYTIDSVGVGYGYGSEAELNETQPTYLVHTVDELSLLLLGFTER
jgi:phosphoglycolate phosphatase